jgi:hypothetical protein
LAFLNCDLFTEVVLPELMFLVEIEEEQHKSKLTPLAPYTGDGGTKKSEDSSARYYLRHASIAQVLVH